MKYMYYISCILKQRKKAPRITGANSQRGGGGEERSPIVSIIICVCVFMLFQKQTSARQIKLVKTFVRRQEIAFLSSRNKNFSRWSVPPDPSSWFLASPNNVHPPPKHSPLASPLSCKDSNPIILKRVNFFSTGLFI